MKNNKWYFFTNKFKEARRKKFLDIARKELIEELKTNPELLEELKTNQHK